MPPFGNIFGVPVYCDTALEQDDEIEFNAGSHQDTIRIKFADFKRLVNPDQFRMAADAPPRRLVASPWAI